MIVIEAIHSKKVTLITYGIHQTEFGKCCIGLTFGGICHLSFNGNSSDCKVRIQEEWPYAQLENDELTTQKILDKIFNNQEEELFQCYVPGTEFQQLVWKALLKIPSGTTTYYEKIAENIGNPKAVRAVASAIGKNPIAYLIPCHRVIPKSGGIGKYRSGSHIKQALLEYENKNLSNLTKKS